MTRGECFKVDLFSTFYFFERPPLTNNGIFEKNDTSSLFLCWFSPDQAVLTVSSDGSPFNCGRHWNTLERKRKMGQVSTGRTEKETCSRLKHGVLTWSGDLDCENCLVLF